VALADGKRLRGLDETARPLGQFVDIHRFASLSLPFSPKALP
jgi:hypothetical protein